MSASEYGSRFAADYDEWYPAGDDVAPIVERVLSLSGGGPVLELGVGTGRVALAMAAAGAQVWGIDASDAMLARLAHKDIDQRVVRVLGDMAALPLPTSAPPFAVAFAAFNTFFLLTTRQDQLACLRRCREALAPDGCVALELYIPARSTPGVDRWCDAIEVGGGRLLARSYRRSRDDSSVLIGETGGRPWSMRPLPLAELDELADEAGLVLAHRWGDWDATPFLAARGTHVSVWRSTR